MTDIDMLDRPVWTALSTRHAKFAVGTDRALRFHDDISPFADTDNESVESLQALAELIPEDGAVMLIKAAEIVIPEGTKAVETGIGVQMVATRFQNAALDYSGISRLGAEHGAEMLALATLTKPGPFAKNTQKMGDFFGIWVDGRLAAMAGERMKQPGFTEVSGVCTHPDFQGRGFAKRLSAIVTSRILSRGETPYLHAYSKNQAAVGLYEKLGFEIRTRVNVAKLEAAD